MRRRCYCFVLCTWTILFAAAQDKTPVKFGKLVPEDFILPSSPAIDSNTSAVIIADVGVTTFKGNANGWVSYVFKRKTRIRMLNKKAFDLATVKISLYTDGEEKEKLEDVAATTYNLENGVVAITKMERKDLFTDKIDKNRLQQKFTLPGVKENSIIEYSYTVISDFYFNIPAWQFQNTEHPCLWSEYQVTIPSLVGYVFNKRGVHKFDIDQASDGHESYLIRPKKENPMTSGVVDNTLSVNANTVKHRWVMKNVPAFYVENYLFTPENYIDEIDFQLARTYNGETTTEVKNNWTKVTDDMLKSNDFASFVNNGQEVYWLDKPVNDLTRNSADNLEAAKDIYYWLTDNFTCTDHHSKYIKTTLQDVFKNHKGNVGEVNLLLTSMLLKKHIEAAPVVLSTREYGYNYASYPILGRLDYVVCKATIDGREYYLDASYPMLGFGRLPPNVYNGHARVISQQDSVSVYFMADSIKEQRVTSVYIINDEKKPGRLSGSCAVAMGYMESFQLRQQAAGKGAQSYFDGLKLAAGDDISFEETRIDSLKKPEYPISTAVDFFIKSLEGNDMIYFNPILWSGYKNNPFSAASRKYPVEMPYPVNDTYVLNMETPAGFIIEEMPKSARVNFNGDDGYFEYLVQKNESGFQLRSRIVMKKAFFDPLDYDSLRDFFGFIVKKQNEQIVFKRKP
jgi:hypothetical protein